MVRAKPHVVALMKELRDLSALGRCHDGRAWSASPSEAAPWLPAVPTPMMPHGGGGRRRRWQSLPACCTGGDDGGVRLQRHVECATENLEQLEKGREKKRKEEARAHVRCLVWIIIKNLYKKKRIETVKFFITISLK